MKFYKFILFVFSCILGSWILLNSWSGKEVKVCREFLSFFVTIYLMGSGTHHYIKWHCCRSLLMVLCFFLLYTLVLLKDNEHEEKVPSIYLHHSTLYTFYICFKLQTIYHYIKVSNKNQVKCPCWCWNLMLWSQVLCWIFLLYNLKIYSIIQWCRQRM